MTKKKTTLEVLAPAGSFESMKAAVSAGADAVYMGGTRFGARAYADNPDEKGVLEAIDYTHLHGRKLYMTVNTLFKESEMGELYDYLLPYYKEGLDAVIVQDLGAMAFIREHFPGLEIHASTQMTLTGSDGAALLEELGASRVVTARELSLEEIRAIHNRTNVEIESFVHGALCYCYSGQCLMSSLIGGRSGNRGRCAQPCRLPYQAGDGTNTSGKPSYLLNLKDLCTLDLIPDMAEAGIYSLKIEGRMKSPRYTAGVVSIYRKYVDRYLEYGREGFYVEPEDKKNLSDLFDRGGFTQGYYQAHNGRDMVALGEKPAFRPANQELFDYLDETYVQTEPKEAIRGQAILTVGEPASLTLSLENDPDLTVSVAGQVVLPAQKQPLSEEKVQKQLEKTGNTPFAFSGLTIQMQGAGFLPIQALNELRRDALEALTQAILEQSRRPEPCAVQSEPEAFSRKEKAETPQMFVSAETVPQFEAALHSPDVSGIYLEAAGEFGAQRWDECVASCHKNGKQCFLALPQIFRSHARAFFKKNQARLSEAGFDGVLVRSMDEISWLRETLPDARMMLDAGVYCWNQETVALYEKLGASAITLPFELNAAELTPVARALGESAVSSELVVYGRLPMMVSAQCIQKTTKGCTKKPVTLFLKDRTGAKLPVKNHCAFCYNTIYNASPLSLLGLDGAVKRLCPDAIRLNLTTESRAEAEQVIAAFSQEFLHEAPTEQPIKDFTRGHFRRGVQ